MSQLFNIYVSGVSQDKQHDADAVRENTAKMFKLKGEELDALLNNDKETCIRRKVSETEAKKYQKIVSDLGLNCTYKPIKAAISLSLVPKEATGHDDEDIFLCPVCNFSKPLNGDPKPLICESCGGNIQAYEKKQAEQKEIEEVRERVVRSQQYRTHLEQKKAKEEAERERKLQIEDTVKKELGIGDDKNKKISLQTLLLIPAVTGIGAIVYLLASQFTGEESTTEKVANNPDFSEQIPMATPPQTAMANTGTVPVQPTGNNSTPSQQPGDLTLLGDQSSMLAGQTSMQDTYNKAESVLNSFGLSTGKLVSGGSNQEPLAHSSTQQTNINTLAQIDTESRTPIALTHSSVREATTHTDSTIVSDEAFNEGLKTFDKTGFRNQSSSSVILPGLLEQLYSDFNRDVEWNNYLSGKINALIDTNNLSGAYQLAINIGDIETHNDAIGKIAQRINNQGKTAFAKRLISQLQEKIQKANPVKPEYYAQVALYQKQIEGETDLFNTAENLEKNLAPLVKRVQSKGKIAVYQKRANLINESYLNLIEAERQLNTLTNPLEKVQAYLAISENYYHTGDLKKSNVHIINALPLIDHESEPEVRSDLYYQTTKILLGTNQYKLALDVAKKITLPEYQSLALASIAAQTKTTALLKPIKASIQNIKSPINQAVIASTSARILHNAGINGHNSDLLSIVDNAIKTIPASVDKDKALAIIARNYSVSSQPDKSNFYSGQISDKQRKIVAQKSISQLNTLVKNS